MPGNFTPDGSENKLIRGLETRHSGTIWNLYKLRGVIEEFGGRFHDKKKHVKNSLFIADHMVGT